MNKFTQKQYLVFSLFFILSVYLITAINSNGYHHPDEHYQIIEFAAYKAWGFPQKDLAWEFNEEIRSSIQPWTCVALLSLFKHLGLKNPYLIATILRIISSLICFSAIGFFVYKTKHIFSKKMFIPYMLLSYLMWYLPYVCSRFSSETWSGMLLLVAIGLLIDSNREKSTQSVNFMLVGILFGFSFLFRFQIAVAIIGVIIWLIIYRKESFHNIFMLCLGGIIVIHIGVMLDFFFYHSLTYTFWSYFQVNIMHGVASNFGIAPWYYYFTEIFKYAFLPFGIILCFSLLIHLLWNRKEVWLWIFIPFVLMHTFIPHKEIRFLFPLAFFTPMLVLKSYSIVKDRFKLEYINVLTTTVLSLLVAMNVCCLLVCAYAPAGNGSKSVTKFIRNQYSTKKVILNYTLSANPYKPYNDIIENFYLTNNITFRFLDSDSLNLVKIPEKNKVNLVVIRRKDLKLVTIRNFLDEYRYKKVFQSIPEEVIWLRRIFWIPDENSILDVYFRSM